MIRVEDLHKTYRETQALKGVSFHVEKGELFAYLGPNGAGKTTTIRILTGLTRLTSGSAWLNGFHVESESLQSKKEFGLVLQFNNLDQELTVRENLEIHGMLHRMSASRRRRRIHELLEYVELFDWANVPVKKLSGGMKRRLMIARALMHAPRILFLDEPTVGLDPGIRRRIWALIRKIQQAGTTIFLTTHYIEEAEFLAGRVAFLDDGRIVTVDRPGSLMTRIGDWAVDYMAEDGMKTAYFEHRSDAENFAARQAGHTAYTLRRVNLEDAFLAWTGKRTHVERLPSGLLPGNPHH